MPQRQEKRRKIPFFCVLCIRVFEFEREKTNSVLEEISQKWQFNHPCTCIHRPNHQTGAAQQQY